MQKLDKDQLSKLTNEFSKSIDDKLVKLIDTKLRDVDLNEIITILVNALGMVMVNHGLFLSLKDDNNDYDLEQFAEYSVFVSSSLTSMFQQQMNFLKRRKELH